ncbi:NDR1/HIN1-like protein 13 [Phragmites australis]|uniref:NDR1/HIN1-like protein 13 n=1 Tax=Phragmites australis TaxID=29695 RepID=UPI002D76ABD5|nr:NDR1/HIN1-like protein 13 [Phragmites australis]
MADRVHPMPQPSSSSPPRRPDRQADADAAAAPTETTPLRKSFRRPLAPPPGTYIVQVPKDLILRVPPPDRARRYRKLVARPTRRRRLRRACCFSCAAILLLILLAAAFVGAVYLIFQPRAPSFSVASISIRGLDNLTLSSSSTLSPELDAGVRADNGANKQVGIDYRGGSEVAVSYSGVRLASGDWPAFYQAPRNVTVFPAALRGQGVSFTEEQRKQLAAEQAAGAVPLTVEARVPVRLRFGKVLWTWTVDVKASCDVTVDRLAGNAAAANRGCRVRVKPLWWWWW